MAYVPPFFLRYACATPREKRRGPPERGNGGRLMVVNTTVKKKKRPVRSRGDQGLVITTGFSSASRGAASMTTC